MTRDILLCSDPDRTLLPNGRQPNSLKGHRLPGINGNDATGVLEGAYSLPDVYAGLVERRNASVES